MSANKKSTKSTKSPAPATKTTAKPAPKKKAAAVPPPVAPLRTPKAKVVESKPVTTKIIAKIDIGFGNALHVRGEGPGLSWDKGTRMNCVADDHWEIVLGESARPFAFKFLVNDLSWSSGADYLVASGESITLVPTFE